MEKTGKNDAFDLQMRKDYYLSNSEHRKLSSSTRLKSGNSQTLVFFFFFFPLDLLREDRLAEKR